MKATEDLKKEHEGIELMLQVLQTVADKFKRGERVSPEHLDGILEFLSIFVDKCHHGKEEEFLFPALESAGIPHYDGPIGVMLNEHEQGRKLVTRLKDTVTSYKSGDNMIMTSAHLILNEYVALMSQHITKENAVLFPMADDKLDEAENAKLLKAFEQLEKERIGPGKHEEFHASLHRLEREYLR
jgi:hemerythrin-like domain-containing protein